jgi:hypothetical protein
MTRRLLASFVAVLVSSSATPTFAITPEQKDKVRGLVKEGGELISNGRFLEARDRLLAALEMARVPAIALYAATANESLRELDKAADLYRMAIEMPLDESLWDGEKSKTEFQLRSREQARSALRQLLERNATVRIQVIGTAGGDLQVTLDGIAVAQASLAYEHPVAQGSHVVAVVQGTKRQSQSVNLERIEHKTVTFDLTPTSESTVAGPPQPSSVSSSLSQDRDSATLPRQVTPKLTQTAPTDSPSRTSSALAWTAYGVGAAGLGVGILGGLVTLGKRSSLISKGCSDDGACPTDRQISASDVDSYNTWRKVTTVGFIVGAIGAATGIALSLTAPTSEQVAQLTLVVGPGSVGARGAF